MKDNVAIIGDIHGELEMLRRIVSEVRKESKHIKIYSLGDLIDRGPNSKGVIDFCITENIRPIMGNHEVWLRMLVEKRVFDSMSMSQMMGGIFTAQSYGVDIGQRMSDIALELVNSIPTSHKKFLSSFPYYRKLDIDGKFYWLIHAGLNRPNAMTLYPKLPEKDADDIMMKEIVTRNMQEKYILWPRPMLPTKFRNSHNLFEFDNGTQVLGHSPVKQPIVTKKFIALDTGCGTCAPRTLSAILLPSKKVIQVEDLGWI